MNSTQKQQRSCGCLSPLRVKDSHRRKRRRLSRYLGRTFQQPDYNSWHKVRQASWCSCKAQPGKDDAEDEVDTNEPLMEEVADDRIFRKDELDRKERESYSAICDWVRKVLVKKPEWADAFIAVRMDGESIREYAARIGADENNITQKLKRAEKKLRENYKNSQI